MDNNTDIPFQKQNKLLFCSICGIIPMLLFAVWLIIAAIISPGYNGGSDYISPVTFGFYSMIQNLVFVVLGLLSVGLAFGLHIGLPSPRNGLLKLGVWSVLIFGLGVFLGGLFPLMGLLPENYLVIVPYNLVTVIGFAVTIMAYIGAVLLIGQGLKYEDSLIWGSYSRYSLVTGGLFIILQILLIIFIFYNIYPGVIQRAFIIILWVWILVTGVKLYLISTNKKPIQGRWI
jgi:hypothetical protein